MGGPDARRGSTDGPRRCGSRCRSCASTRGDEQVWGLNVYRFVPSNNETDYWVAVPRDREGLGVAVRRAARYRRREARCIASSCCRYVAGSSTLTGNRDRRNPFDDGKNLAGRAGADVKIGFGSNLTLDATVNPDFGQVEADPAEVNLSAFETFFSEKRPFFIEGSGLLNSPFEGYFYSRRIGARADRTRRPATSSTIRARAPSWVPRKLTGRLAVEDIDRRPDGAVTGAERATTFDLASGGRRARCLLRRRPAYAVGRVQQEFGRNASTAAIMITDVHRDLRPGDPLASLLTRNAFAANGDTLLRFRGGAVRAVGPGGAHARRRRRRRRSPACSAAARITFSVPTRPTRGSIPCERRWTAAHAFVAFARTGGTHWVWNVNEQRRIARVRGQRHRPPDGGRRHYGALLS
mgnify:CR=1 FL=1